MVSCVSSLEGIHNNNMQWKHRTMNHELHHITNTLTTFTNMINHWLWQSWRIEKRFWTCWHWCKMVGIDSISIRKLHIHIHIQVQRVSKDKEWVICIRLKYRKMSIPYRGQNALTSNTLEMSKVFFLVCFIHIWYGCFSFQKKALHACDMDDPHNENRINGSSKWFWVMRLIRAEEKV